MLIVSILYTSISILKYQFLLMWSSIKNRFLIPNPHRIYNHHHVIMCDSSGISIYQCMSLQLTWCASSLLKVYVTEVQHAGHHPEQVQLLRVIQADLLHRHRHPVEVSLVVQQRVLQRAWLQVLRNKSMDCYWPLILLPSFITTSASFLLTYQLTFSYISTRLHLFWPFNLTSLLSFISSSIYLLSSLPPLSVCLPLCIRVNIKYFCVI